MFTKCQVLGRHTSCHFLMVRIVKAMVFPVVINGCESWTIKLNTENWCFWTVVLKKTLKSPLDCKINPKEISPEYSLKRLVLKLKLQYFGHLMGRLIGKDPDAGKDWRLEKGTTEDEMVGWHHRLDGHETEQAPGVGDGLESLVCFRPWALKGSDMTELLN